MNHEDIRLEQQIESIDQWCFEVIVAHYEHPCIKELMPDLKSIRALLRIQDGRQGMLRRLVRLQARILAQVKCLANSCLSDEDAPDIISEQHAPVMDSNLSAPAMREDAPTPDSRGP